MTESPRALAADEIEAAAARLSDIRSRMGAACARAGRDPAEVLLVGASKRQPLARLAATLVAAADEPLPGGLEFGENYVQEARDKREGLAAWLTEQPKPPALPRLRLIGNLQRNKAKLATEVFSAVDTVDRPALAEALSRRAIGQHAILPICIQVNLSGEAQKSGCLEDALPELVDACAPLEGIVLRGLMTVPAATPDPESARPTFARLRSLRDTLCDAPGAEQLVDLSMGMSGDFEVAIEEGATIIRVGTALFGERPAARG